MICVLYDIYSIYIVYMYVFEEKLIGKYGLICQIVFIIFLKNVYILNVDILFVNNMRHELQICAHIFIYFIIW